METIGRIGSIRIGCRYIFESRPKGHDGLGQLLEGVAPATGFQLGPWL